MSFLHTLGTLSVPYGCDTIGRLQSVVVHTPGKELALVHQNTREYWLFQDVPDVLRFRDEHMRYQALLEMNGVTIFELSDYVFEHKEMIEKLPNVTYLHDTAVISDKGAILSNMASTVRKNEKLVVVEALGNLGVPMLINFDDESDMFEACQIFSPEMLLVFGTDRFKYESIYQFIRLVLDRFDEVIFVNICKKRGFTHADAIFNRISPRLAVAYMPAFRETYLFRRGVVRKIDFCEHMTHRGIEIVTISESEQRRKGCSFVPLDRGVIIHDDDALDKYTRQYLSRKGVEFIFHHSRYLKAGGGSIRSLTLRLNRGDSNTIT